VEGAQPIRPLGMADRRQMIQKGGVVQEEGRHSLVRRVDEASGRSRHAPSTRRRCGYSSARSRGAGEAVVYGFAKAFPRNRRNGNGGRA